MHLLKTINIIAFAAAAALALNSCGKRHSADMVIVEGTLEKQGGTTYQYGTHILVTANSSRLVMSSDIVRLDNYEGSRVRVSAFRNTNMVENGPPLHKVTTIKKLK